MPRSTAAILLAVAAAIAGLPIYFLIGAAIDHNLISLGSDMPWPSLIGSTTAALIAGAWAAIFRRSINWTRARVWRSIAAFLSIALVTGIATGLGRKFGGREEALMFTPLLGIAATLAALTILWRQTPAELRQRATVRSVPCPICGYNLAGLKHAACPECGGEFTLEQLARRDAKDEPTA